MLKSEVRDAFFNAVAAKVKPLGFQSNKKEFSFTRKFEGGFHRITFPIVDYAPEINASVLVGTRLDNVDDLANRFNTTIVPEARSRKTIIQAEPKYFGGPRNYVICDESELISGLAQMLDLFENHLLPFMDRCTDLAFVKNALQSESGSQLQPNPLGRALTIIASASLCGDQDIATLGAQTRARLELRNIGSELQIFDQTLDYILKGETE